ncbi:MAG: hypothetical protein Kow0063_31940 [Anaerolineae bacterium]
MMHGHSSHGNPVPSWLSEAAEWRDAVRAYVSRHPEARAIDIAAGLGCTEAEALSALSEAAWEIPAAHLPALLAEVSTWERVLVLVRNQDAIAEVEVPGDGGRLSGDWLNWIDEGYNLHLRIAATQRILALVRRGRRGPTFSFNLVNQAGQVFCRFYARSQTSKERFLRFCEQYPAGEV